MVDPVRETAARGDDDHIGSGERNARVQIGLQYQARAELIARLIGSSLSSARDVQIFRIKTGRERLAERLGVAHTLAQAQFHPIRAIEESLFCAGARGKATKFQRHLLMHAQLGQSARFKHAATPAQPDAVCNRRIQIETQSLLLVSARLLAPARAGIDGEAKIVFEVLYANSIDPELRVLLLRIYWRETRGQGANESGDHRETLCHDTIIGDEGVSYQPEFTRTNTAPVLASQPLLCHRLSQPNHPTDLRASLRENAPMKFFVDTAEIADIKELAATGLLDGVTTNPSLIHKSGRDFMEVTKEICGIVDGPVSAEVVALDHETMMREAEILRKIADNVCIKVPLTVDGLKTCKALTGDGTMVNVTLCFSANQALLAAKAGASFISPFVGRHDDNGFDGMELIEDIRLIYDNYGFETEILVASIRHTTHVLESAKIGADVITAPPKVILGLFKHVLTDKGIEAFLADWEKTGQSIV